MGGGGEAEMGKETLFWTIATRSALSSEHRSSRTVAMLRPSLVSRNWVRI